ncbi:MAG: hypothetical protein R2819_00560 [Allomuricauda sp.]
MKLQRIFMLACMVMSIALVSCSGEDGKDGADSTVPGPTGDAGDDGINCWDLNGNGTGDIKPGQADNEDINGDNKVDALDCQGMDGEQGVAGPSAERIIMITSGITAGTNPVSLDVPELTQAVLDTHVLLVYISDGAATYYPVPGTFIIINQTYIFGVEYTTGNITLSEYTNKGWLHNLFNEVHIVLIETSSMGGKSQADVMASLKAHGVDTNNYKDVVKFLGLE